MPVGIDLFHKHANMHAELAPSAKPRWKEKWMSRSSQPVHTPLTQLWCHTHKTTVGIVVLSGPGFCRQRDVYTIPYRSLDPVPSSITPLAYKSSHKAVWDIHGLYYLWSMRVNHVARFYPQYAKNIRSVRCLICTYRISARPYQNWCIKTPRCILDGWPGIAVSPIFFKELSHRMA